MVLALIHNIALLVALSLGYQALVRSWREWTLPRQIVSGALFGIITVIGMLTPFRAAVGIQYDGRSIILAVAGVFGGPIVAIVAAAIALAYRVWLGGTGTIAGILVIVESAGLGIAYYYFRKHTLRANRWLPLYALAFTVHAVLLALQYALLGDAGPSIVRQIWFPVLVLYPLGMLLVCRLMLDQEQHVEDQTALRELNESLERKVDERTEELRAVNEELLDASEAKSQFLRAMSHELRTPLNSILGFSNLLQRGVTGPVNDEQVKQLRMVNRSGQRLLGIVNDVLDLARIEARNATVQYEPFDICMLVEETAASLLPTAGAKGLTVSVESPRRAVIITSDQDKVGRIVLNLLANAVKFTDSGGAVVRVALPEAETVTIEVRDTGRGVPDEVRERLFTEFVQEDDHVEGTGLGLAISHGLAELLGGSLVLESSSREGSTFKLSLPTNPKG